MGINEKAAQTTGTNVLRYKWYSVLITGFFVGIAAQYFRLEAPPYSRRMSAGRVPGVAAIMIAKESGAGSGVQFHVCLCPGPCGQHAELRDSVPDCPGPALFHDHSSAAGFGIRGRVKKGAVETAWEKDGVEQNMIQEYTRRLLKSCLIHPQRPIIIQMPEQRQADGKAEQPRDPEQLGAHEHAGEGHHG